MHCSKVRYNGVMERSANILVIEDDTDINDVIATYLSRHGFCCTQAFSGSEARLLLESRSASQSEPFDLVITDLMLPGLSGRDLVELIRENGNTPIIVVSALTSATDKVSLLGSGADDYLTKPFDLEELLARVNVQLRHAARPSASPAATSGTAHFKKWVLDRQARTLTAAGEAVKLTRLEFNIVDALVRHPKKAFTKRELLETAWQEESFVEEKAINVHVSNIRNKLKPSGTDGYIETVWGIGFKLAE